MYEMDESPVDVESAREWLCGRFSCSVEEWLYVQFLLMDAAVEDELPF